MRAITDGAFLITPPDDDAFFPSKLIVFLFQGIHIWFSLKIDYFSRTHEQIPFYYS
jgi:hypothetical protein